MSKAKKITDSVTNIKPTKLRKPLTVTGTGRFSGTKPNKANVPQAAVPEASPTQKVMDILRVIEPEERNAVLQEVIQLTDAAHKQLLSEADANLRRRDAALNTLYDILNGKQPKEMANTPFTR